MKLATRSSNSLSPFSALCSCWPSAFCLFGFLATFEPTTNTTQFVMFRIGYAVIGVGRLVGIGFVLAKALRK